MKKKILLGASIMLCAFGASYALEETGTTEQIETTEATEESSEGTDVNPDEGDGGEVNPGESGETNPSEGEGSEVNPGESGDENSEPAPAYSGTLPVVYVNTENNVPIDQKVEYIPATLWIDSMGIEGFDALGSEDAPITLGIRGRGNYTWGLEKKPYKIKFDKKQEVLGMPKNKHWALMAQAGIYSAYTNYAAFNFGRVLGLGWQPNMKPVELVLNGEYVGIYYLTETIRVDKNRVNIYEQKDGETNEALIKGGWIVEVDNYPDEDQIVFEEKPGSTLSITSKSPEGLSDAQYGWLLNEFKHINSLIYIEDKYDNSWEEYIDAEKLAKYFILEELLDNSDAYLGSWYMTKDLKEGAKWECGPIWDTSSNMRERTDFTIFSPFWGNGPYKVEPHWIKELLKFPHFIEVIREVTNNYISADNSLDDVKSAVLSLGKDVNGAIMYNYERWPADRSASGTYRAKMVNSVLDANRNFLINKINTRVESLDIDAEELTIEVDNSAVLTATKTPAEAIDPIIFTSSDPSIATIDENGNITPHAGGVTTISVYCDGFVKECVVTVDANACDTPVITVEDGKLKVNGSVENAVYHTNIKAIDHGSLEHSDADEIDLSGVYEISSYATAEGYGPSLVANATLVWVKDPEVNVSVIEMETVRPILVHSVGNYIVVSGLSENEAISLMDITGIEQWSGTASCETFTIPMNLNKGQVYLIKVGKRTFKYKL